VCEGLVSLYKVPLLNKEELDIVMADIPMPPVTVRRFVCLETLFLASG
jgi:hypothetical protein